MTANNLFNSVSVEYAKLLNRARLMNRVNKATLSRAPSTLPQGGVTHAQEKHPDNYAFHFDGRLPGASCFTGPAIPQPRIIF
jgi:hypothetical protein